MAQLQLQKEVALDLVPMTRQPASGRNKAKWIIAPKVTATAASSSIASNVRDAANTPILIKFTPEGTEVYTGSRPANILPNIFYLPKSVNQPAFDSFILADEVLYIFQFSVASKHDINPSVMDFSSHATLKEALWRFIFVVPPDGTLEYPEPSGVAGEKLKEFWKRVTLFTAEFDPSKHTGSARDEDGDEIMRTQSPPPSTAAPAEPSTSTLSQRDKGKARTVPAVQKPAIDDNEDDETSDVPATRSKIKSLLFRPKRKAEDAQAQDPARPKGDKRRDL
jgi:hypothetical protein